MIKVCVTGATGFIGGVLIRELLKEGFSVRAICRPDSDTTYLQKLNVDTFILKFTDIPALTHAFSGCKAVFHSAGDTDFTHANWEKVYQTNVEGTANIIAAAKRTNIERLVYTSSTAAIGSACDPDHPADESYVYDGDRMGYTYYQTKHLAEIKTEQAAKNGLEIVIVNPTTALGRYGKNQFFTKLIKVAKYGILRVAPCGGLNVVDVEDVARGQILALKHGDNGQRYILGGANMPWTELISNINIALGKSGKVVAAPKGSYAALGSLLENIYAPFSDYKIIFGKDMGEIAETHRYYSSEKAKRMLGYTAIPLHETLRKTIDWMKEESIF